MQQTPLKVTFRNFKYLTDIGHSMSVCLAHTPISLSTSMLCKVVLKALQKSTQWSPLTYQDSHLIC